MGCDLNRIILTLFILSFNSLYSFDAKIAGEAQYQLKNTGRISFVLRNIKDLKILTFVDGLKFYKKILGSSGDYDDICIVFVPNSNNFQKTFTKVELAYSDNKNKPICKSFWIKVSN